MSDIQIKPVSVVEALRLAIAEEIFNLSYPPGAQLTEAALSARFSVSRNTLREAIAELCGLGLLTKTARCGVFVKEITKKDVHEIFHFRAVLESEAVRLIIQNGRQIPASLAALAEECETMPASDADWTHFVQTDLSFHHALVLAAGSDRLARLYEAIRHEIMLALCQARRTLIENPKNAYEHRLFISAIREGTAEDAAALVSAHIQSGTRSLANAFRQ